ncbi:MAG: hypothetical protein ACOVVK_10775 [Elsteraceae bacterium]
MSFLNDFNASLTALEPPQGYSLALQALWWDAKGDWARAHECAQACDDLESAWAHAYLHRVEGDLANAGYWYRRAKRPVGVGDLAQERASIALALKPAGAAL